MLTCANRVFLSIKPPRSTKLTASITVLPATQTATSLRFNAFWMVPGTRRGKLADSSLSLYCMLAHRIISHNFVYQHQSFDDVIDPLAVGFSLPHCFGPQLLNVSKGTPRTGSPAYLFQRLESADPLPLLFQLAAIAHLYVSTTRPCPGARLGQRHPPLTLSYTASLRVRAVRPAPN